MGDAMVSRLGRAAAWTGVATALTTAPVSGDVRPPYAAPVTDPTSSNTVMVDPPEAPSLFDSTVDVARDANAAVEAASDATRIGDESTGDDPYPEPEQVVEGPPDPPTEGPDLWDLADGFPDTEPAAADIADVADDPGSDIGEDGL